MEEVEYEESTERGTPPFISWLGTTLSGLLCRGQFLVDPAWPGGRCACLVDATDPMLVETMHAIARSGVPSVAVDTARGGPAHLMTGSADATFLLGLDASYFAATSGGPLRTAFAEASRVREGGKYPHGTGTPNVRPSVRSLHERMFGFAGFQPVCDATASDVAPPASCPARGRRARGLSPPHLMELPAIAVLKGWMDACLGGDDAVPPRTGQEFLSLKELASLAVFGEDASDLLAGGILRVESGETGPEVDGVVLAMRDFAVGCISEPLPGTLAEVGAALAAECYPEISPDALAFQAAGWFASLTNLLCLSLPTALALLSSYPDAMREAERECLLGDGFDPASECTFLNAVAMETLRLYNPATALRRTLARGVSLPASSFGVGSGDGDCDDDDDDDDVIRYRGNGYDGDGGYGECGGGGGGGGGGGEETATSVPSPASATMADAVSLYPGDVVLFPFESYMRDPACYRYPDAFLPERWREGTADADAIASAVEGGRGCQDVFSTGARTCPARRGALFVLRYAIYRLLRGYCYTMVGAASRGEPRGIGGVPDVLDVPSLVFAVHARQG